MKARQKHTRQSGKGRVEKNRYIYCLINQGNGEQVDKCADMVRAGKGQEGVAGAVMI